MSNSKEQKPKLLIIGHKRHGKDTMAEILKDNFDFTYKSSSSAAAEIFIYEALKYKYNYKSIEQCFMDRVNHREEWFTLICEYNKEDKLRLSKNILSNSDCYVGMRDYNEVEASKDLFDIIVWVDASNRLPLEDASSITTTREQAHIVIENNTDYKSFEEKIKRFGRLLY